MIGYCVAQVRVVFRLPKEASNAWFSADVRNRLPSHLAYVEWFTPFTPQQLGRDHRMYKVSRLKQLNGTRKASVVPIELIRQSVHLIPIFGAIAPANWKSSNVLDESEQFLVNSFSDRFPYTTLL